MKLYLSSVGIPNVDAFKALIGDDRPKTVGVIANAWDVYPGEKSGPFIAARLAELTAVGLRPRLINLQDYTDATVLRAELDTLGALWVTGGNSFYLNGLLHEHNLLSAIVGAVKHGLVYGGESAGAVLTGPTIHGAELMDDQTKAPTVYWDGLNLVDFGIVPHWDNPKYAHILQDCKAEMLRHVRVVKTLDDGQTLIVQ